jgi:hypothetical protein
MDDRRERGMADHGLQSSEDLVYALAGLCGAGASTVIVMTIEGFHLLALMVTPAGFLVGAGTMQALVGFLNQFRR